MDLCCPHWLTDFSRGLRNLQEQGLFCDVVIQTAECETYSAHANVLAAASPILSTYMQDSGLFVKFDEISAQTWQRLLEFMYTGKVFGVPPSDAHLLYEAARKLGIDTLTSLIDSQPDIKPHLASTEQGPPTEFVKDEDDDDDDDESEAAMEDEDNDAETSTSGNPHEMEHPTTSTPSKTGYTISPMLDSDTSDTSDTSAPSELDNIEVPDANFQVETFTSIRSPDENSQKYRCGDCKFSSKYKTSLSRHIKNSHGKGNIYRCKIEGCTKSYVQKFDLQTHHQMVHNAENNFCSTCGKSFSSRRGLEGHEQSHTGSQGHSCPYEECSKTFSRPSHLAAHVNFAHAKLAPFKCSQRGCKKTYFSTQACKQHEQVCRSSENRPICERCGSQFTTFRALRDHTNSVHKQNVYRCSCGKSFKWRPSLYRHKKLTGH